MRVFGLGVLCLLCVGSVVATPSAAHGEEIVDPSLYGAMKWRFVAS